MHNIINDWAAFDKHYACVWWGHVFKHFNSIVLKCAQSELINTSRSFNSLILSFARFPFIYTANSVACNNFAISTDKLQKPMMLHQNKSISRYLSISLYVSVHCFIMKDQGIMYDPNFIIILHRMCGKCMRWTFV